MAQATPPSPTLLLIRPEEQSRAFLERVTSAIGRPVKAVISPVLKIEPVGTIPDITGFDGIIVTSGHAVRRLGRALEGQQVLTVGETTAELARTMGAEATCLGADVAAFIEAWRARDGTYLYARGRHVRTDLAAALGPGLHDAIVYDQVSQNLNAEARRLLDGGSAVIVPLFSARSAVLFAEKLSGDETVTALAISDAVARAWPLAGPVSVARTPDASGLCDLVIREL